MRVAPATPYHLSPRALAFVGWISLFITGAIFLTIARDVATHAPLVLFDAKVAAWLHGHASPWLLALLLAVTQLHSVLGASLLTAAFALFLARMREWYWLLTLGLAMGGGMALNDLLKHFYERARPHFDDPWISEASFSFPSGHTAGAVLFYGVLAAFVISKHHDWLRRAAVVAAALLAIAAVAFSRLYLGAHYLSDVAAAATSSAAWLVLSLSVVHARVLRQQARSAA